MPFYFGSDIDPNKPLDPADPCPSGWDTVIEDARDRSAQFHGHEPAHLSIYIQWAARERTRLAKLKVPETV